MFQTVNLGTDWYVEEYTVVPAGVSLDVVDRVTSFTVFNTSDQTIYLYRDVTRNKTVPIFPNQFINFEIDRTGHYGTGNQSLGYLKSGSGTIVIPILIVITAPRP